MKNILVILLLFSWVAFAQKNAPRTPPKEAPAAAQQDVSGMYSFLKEGEFVEVDLDGNNVTGFISRYGDSESDRGAFLDHMFSGGSYDGKNLSFKTKEVHGVTYEFKGKVERGEGKQPGSEAYYVLKGTLTETTLDANKKPNARQREVEFKSFPADAQLSTPKKD